MGLYVSKSCGACEALEDDINAILSTKKSNKLLQSYKYFHHDGSLHEIFLILKGPVIASKKHQIPIVASTMHNNLINLLISHKVRGYVHIIASKDDENLYKLSTTRVHLNGTTNIYKTNDRYETDILIDPKTRRRNDQSRSRTSSSSDVSSTASFIMIPNMS